ncbi:MAG: leucine-rich repeat protein [Clostridia bacterium]|nr:leucine-rich repeat protein [Clostridia bacterium]
MKNSKIKAVFWVFVILSLAIISALSLSALGELPEGATAKGHITKLLDGSKIVDTNWGYYAETKTLYLAGNQSSYNETGALKDCDEGQSWEAYKDEIEHIVVGKNISKITGLSFDGYNSIIDVCIEKNVTQIDTYAFRNCSALTTLWINGTERVEGRFDASSLKKTNDIFPGTAVKEVVLGKNDKNPVFTPTKVMKTVYASEINDDVKIFCADRGLTLINLADMSTVDTTVKQEVTYKPEGATVSGHSSKLYEGSRIVDTNWAYYADTKTLEFVGNQKAYNETGALKDCDPASSWEAYKDEIEHIIVGPQITKITGFGFEGYPALKDVRIESTVGQIDTGAFNDCPALTTLWVNGTERIEGRFDLSTFSAANNFFTNTSVKEVVLGEKISSPGFTAPPSLECIYAKNVTVSMKVFAKDAGVKLIDFNTGAEVDTNVSLSASYKPEGATVSGHSTKKYNGGKIVDTFWAYYADTKTLEFVSNSTSYNETGSVSNCDGDGDTWIEYKDEIEHIIVGDKISKVTGNAFASYKSLVDVRLGKNVTQIDAGAFTNCEKLTTIWFDGTERVEGRADLSKIPVLALAFKGTSIREIVLSPKTTSISSAIPLTVTTIYAPSLTDELIAFAKENLCDLVNINNPSEAYRNYIEVDLSLPSCGPRCVFDFDEATGVLTIKGGGMISDTVNYYGGGSKNSPFFTIKQKVKKIVIEEHIKGLGKYAFCQFTNLESVELPDVEGFVIMNAAFEKCSNLKYVYRAGTDPIEGTADLSKVASVSAWAFAYDYLIANVILSDAVTELGSSVFEENINLQSIYGIPGSYAETFASENGLNFLDIASNTPEAIKCTPPENVSEGIHEDDTESAVETEEAPETEPDFVIVFHNKGENTAARAANPLPIIIVIAAVAVCVIAVIIILLKIKKSKKKA